MASTRWPVSGTDLDAVVQYVCLVLFVMLMAAPMAYGLHMYVLMLLALRRRRSVRTTQAALRQRAAGERAASDWPMVTTQIPLYNELNVAARVIRAAAAMDYPPERHEIQVLDDSTDATRGVVDRVCAELQAGGRPVRVIRRGHRTHYKAGALAAGLAEARGQYVAIFDADFIPEPGFLRSMLPLLEADPQAACVQARWGHLNAGDSWMTQALALGMDGHFGVEQPARGWNGLLLNFNGTAGIWRREAIEDPRVGGWSGETITEDLDLSYRAQLAGWRIVYTQDEVAPAEIPGAAAALKAQQRRWATGSIQTARKLLPRLWGSRLTLAQKLEATLHLTQYSVNVFMLLMVLFGRALLGFVPPEIYQACLPAASVVILLAAAAPSAAYCFARWSLGQPVPGPVRIVQLITLGFGLSVNNSLAVLAGLRQRGGEFVRTPKSGATGDGRVRSAPYAAAQSRVWLAELAVGGFCLLQWALFLPADKYVNGTFLLLAGVGMTSLGWQSRPQPAGGLEQAEPYVAGEGDLATALESPSR